MGPVQSPCQRVSDDQSPLVKEGTFQNRDKNNETDSETVIIQPQVSSVSITITGGRIKNFLAKWQDITSDRTIVYCTGYKLEFYDLQPVKIGRVRPTILNSEAAMALDQQIQNFLSWGIIIESHYESTEFISLVFLREKKNGSFRMILNLKELNSSF